MPQWRGVNRGYEEREEVFGKCDKTRYAVALGYQGYDLRKEGVEDIY